MTTPPRNPTTTTTSPGEAAAEPSGAAGANPDARIIKRYSNRKLYDTVESRYVTLPQIAELLRKGEDVRIIDNNSKDDLTSVTLAQILYEEERKQSRALPLTALKDLIHTSSEKIMSTLRETPMVGKLMGPKGEGLEGGAPGAAATPAPTQGAGTSPGAVSAGGAGPSTQPAPASLSNPPGEAGTGRLYEMLEQSRVSVQEWQHRVDERVRKVLESFSPTGQVEKLQLEVRRLTQRLEELEARLEPGASPRKDVE